MARASFTEKLAAAREQVRADSASVRTKLPPRTIEANNSTRTITPRAPGTPVCRTQALSCAQPTVTTGTALAMPRRLRRRKTPGRGNRCRSFQAALAQIAGVFGAIYEVVQDADTGVVSVVLQERGGATLTLGRRDGAWHLDIASDDGTLCGHGEALTERFEREALGPIVLTVGGTQYT